MYFMMQKVEIKRTRLYQDCQCQLDEINRHKWIESEKAGHNVGWEWALIDWIIHHRANWIRHQLAMKSGSAMPQSTGDSTEPQSPRRR